MELLTSTSLLFGSDEVTTAAALAGKTTVALYFSAHWCGPCRRFTPSLVAARAAAVAAGNGNECLAVFCSSDSDEESFQEYYGEMTGFHALPYRERDLEEALKEKLGVAGLPTLVVIDCATGNVITKDGRSIVAKFGAAAFPLTAEVIASCAAAAAADAADAATGISDLEGAAASGGAVAGGVTKEAATSAAEEDESAWPIVLLTRDAHAAGKWLLSLESALIAKGAAVLILPLSSFTRVGNWRCLVNRVSDAAPPAEVKRCMAALRAAELRGVRTVNGLSCYAVGSSKLLHHELFECVGADTPSWLQVSRGDAPAKITSAAAAAGLQYPLLIKPNAGGFGKGIESIASASDLTSAIVDAALGEDGLAVIQNFVAPLDGYTYRVYFLDGAVQCAVKVHATAVDGFNACVLSCAELAVWEVPDDVAQHVTAMARTAGANVGSIELLYVAESSRPQFFDFNLLSTYPNDVAYEQLADFILQKS